MVITKLKKIKLIPIVYFTFSYLQGILLSFVIFINKIRGKIKNSKCGFLLLTIINSVIFMINWFIVNENQKLMDRLSQYLGIMNLGSLLRNNLKTSLFIRIGLFIIIILIYLYLNLKGYYKKKLILKDVMFLFTFINLFFLLTAFSEYKDIIGTRERLNYFESKFKSPKEEFKRIFDIQN